MLSTKDKVEYIKNTRQCSWSVSQPLRSGATREQRVMGTCELCECFHYTDVNKEV